MTNFKLCSIAGLMCLPWLISGCQHLPTNAHATPVNTTSKAPSATSADKTLTKTKQTSKKYKPSSLNAAPNTSGTKTLSDQKQPAPYQTTRASTPSTKKTQELKITKADTKAQPKTKQKVAQTAEDTIKNAQSPLRSPTAQTPTQKPTAQTPETQVPTTQASTTKASTTLAKLHRPPLVNETGADQLPINEGSNQGPNDQEPNNQEQTTVLPLHPASSDQFSLQDLPLAIDSHWQLALQGVPGKCSLESQAYTMEDGQGGTTFKVMLNQEKLRFKTTSNIDLSYEGDGLWVNNGANAQRFEFDTLEGQTNAVIDSKLTTVFEQLRQARSLEVHIGFWPTWPKTQTYSQRIPVENFAKAEALLKQCNQLVSGS